MNIAHSALPFLAICAPLARSYGQQVFKMQNAGGGSSRICSLAVGFDSRSFGNKSYDNWRFPGAQPPLEAGISVMSQMLQIGGDEVGDDLHLESWQPSRVCDTAFTMWNFSATQDITELTVTHRYYNSHRELLGTESYVLSGATIYAGTGAFFYSSGGANLGFLLPTSEDMFMTIQFSNAINYDIANIGLLYGGPVSHGSSSRFIQNFGTGQSLDLGSPDMNLGFFIDTIPVPAPNTIPIMIAGCLIAMRRRRM